MISHIKNRVKRPFPVDLWVVVAWSTGRSLASSYLDPVLSLEILSTMGEEFENTMEESMPLQEWVSYLNTSRDY